jgi:predicted amidohydrolase
MHERLFHGFGDGTDLDVTETRVGRIGGLICRENRMPGALRAVRERRATLGSSHEI